MVEISWWLWLGIGLFVSVTSAVMGGPLWLFMWVGILFVIFGIGKLVIKVVLSPKEEKRATQAPAPVDRPQGFYCPRCRVSIHPTDVFCRYCGTRLR